MIRSKKELLAALDADPDARLHWSIGSTSAERNGVYVLRSLGREDTVHGGAAKAAIAAGEIKELRRTSSWSCCAYRRVR